MEEQLQQVNIQIQPQDTINATNKQQQQQQIESTTTIIDIPTIKELEEEKKENFLIITPPSPCSSLSLSTASSSSSSSSSSSAGGTSYDTDSSIGGSSTCCTKHGEEIYMERGGISADTDADDDMDSVHFKADHTKSWPIFILAISLIEIAIFVYDIVQIQPKTTTTTTALPIPIPTDSVLIYRPDRRLEIWRFVSYMFLHANLFHLGFNVVVQLFYGIPLEVMHGSGRIAIIYFAGVFAGSLGTSVVDSEVYLVGASGGVYALLAAHLANITLNYAQMKYAVAQLLSVLIFVSCDLGYAFYTQYLDNGEANKLLKNHIKTDVLTTHDNTHILQQQQQQQQHHQQLHNTLEGHSILLGGRTAPPVSYIAHLTGALAGLTIGLLVLKNFERRAYKNLIWWLALGIYSAFTVFAIVFNLINTMTAQLMEEQGEVITQHLLHDLGVS